MSFDPTRPQDMVLRDLEVKLSGSRFHISTRGIPILHYRGQRVLWKTRLRHFEVYSGHREGGNDTPRIFKDDTSLLLALAPLANAAPAVCAPACPYCGSQSQLRDKALVTGYASGKLYLCANYPQCDAYVGANDVTAEPLGTLANESLRKLRVRAHNALDPLWIGRGPKARVETYIAVAEVLGIKSFHIGTSTVEQCEQVIDQVDAVQERLHAKATVAGSGNAANRFSQQSLQLF